MQAGEIDLMVNLPPDEVARIGSESKFKVFKAPVDGMKIVIDQTNAVLPVAGVFRTYAHSDRVQGFVAHPSFTNQGWWSVSLAAK